ncbi:MAG: diadenylate cyclase CdaA [Verrucomicrobia bacterium]|nr:diadenylate cyclase CdaA [Verrucomicrobiota bacterium]
MLELAQAVAEVLIIFVIYYLVLLFIKGTRAEQLIWGVAVLVVVYLGAQRLHFDVLVYMLSSFFQVFILAVIIIFHPELRQVLANIGKRKFFSPGDETHRMVPAIARAATNMASKKIGALIAIERDISLGELIRSGVEINAEATSELIVTVFTYGSPLHDGGIVISGSTLRSAACIFPLSSRTLLEKSVGTRHRAALGLTEETDALVIVVSEETGRISIAEKGRLQRQVGERRLTEALEEVYAPPRRGWTLGLWGRHP